MIQSALSGKYQISAFHGFFHADCIQYQFNTRQQFCSEEAQKGKSKTSGCSCTFHEGTVRTHAFFSHFCIGTHCFIKAFPHLFCYTFLGTIDVGGAVFSTKRIGDIAGNPEMTFFQFRQHICRTDLYYFTQCIRTDAGRFSVLIQKFISKSSQHTDTAIIGSTSANTDNEFTASAFNGIFDHLTDTIGGSFQRPFVFAHQNNSCSGSHLHDGCPCFLNHSISRSDRSFQRSMNLNLHQISTHAFYQCLRCAFSTVRKRFHRYFRIRQHIQDALLNGTSCFHRAQASL